MTSCVRWAQVKALLDGDGQRSARARQWLRAERVVSRLPMFRDVVAFLFGAGAALPRASVSPARNPSGPPIVAAPPALATDAPPVQKPTTAHQTFPTALVLGEKLLAGSASGPFSVSLDNLTKHTVVLAGAGSGKTVLVRRVIEEAALAGIPSIVIDGANDLSRLGDAWPTRSRRLLRQRSEQGATVPGRNRGSHLDPRTRAWQSASLRPVAGLRVRVEGS